MHVRLSVLPALLSLSLLAGCAQLSALSRSAAPQLADQAASKAPSTETVVENAKPFSDEDEGSAGPVQDANEGKVVFSNEEIPRKEASAAKLVTETTLNKPLYFRAFFPKTPARLLYEEKHLQCPASKRVLRFYGRLEGTEKWQILSVMEAPTLFTVLRTHSVATPDKKLASWVPTAPFAFDEDGERRLDADFLQLAAMMKPGKNAVDVKLEAQCDDLRNPVQHPISQGRIVFDVTPAGLKGLAKLVKVRDGEPSSTKRLRAVYTSKLVPGAKLYAFAAHGTSLTALEKKETDLSVVQLNADKSCTAMRTRWVEPYAGGGVYAEGYRDAVMTKALTIPCP